MRTFLEIRVLALAPALVLVRRHPALGRKARLARNVGAFCNYFATITVAAASIILSPFSTHVPLAPALFRLSRPSLSTRPAPESSQGFDRIGQEQETFRRKGKELPGPRPSALSASSVFVSMSCLKRLPYWLARSCLPVFIQQSSKVLHPDSPIRHLYFVNTTGNCLRRGSRSFDSLLCTAYPLSTTSALFGCPFFSPVSLASSRPMAMGVRAVGRAPPFL